MKRCWHTAQFSEALSSFISFLSRSTTKGSEAAEGSGSGSGSESRELDDAAEETEGARMTLRDGRDDEEETEATGFEAAAAAMLALA